MTRGDIKTQAAVYLGDIGASFYDDTDLNTSIQEAYTAIVAKTQAIKTNGTISVGCKNFIDLRAAFSDYQGCLGIFNVPQNVWLWDDISYPQGFQRMRNDWQHSVGQPRSWAPVDSRQVVVFPRMTQGSTTSLQVFYSQVAPTLTNDSDVILLPENFNKDILDYVQADLLEQFKEFSKALGHWKNYYDARKSRATQVSQLAKASLRMMA